MSECLTLEKTNNILNGIEFVEYLPKNRIQALLASGVLLLDWGEKFSFDLNKEKVRQHYANEVEQIKNYLKAYNPVLGGVKVKYSRFRAFFGRVYLALHYGFTAFRKVVRNSLILDLYYDFDLVCAHQAILVSLCDKANILCPTIKTYVENRGGIIKNVCEVYGVDEDDAKDLFIRLNFGGKFNSWVVENKISNINPTNFIVTYEREVKDIAEKLKDVNKPLWDIVKGQKVKKDNQLGSFLSLYLQEWEVRIVSYCLNHLINHTNFCKHPTSVNCSFPVGSYEYDGFKLLKENVDKNGGLDAVLDIIHQKTAEFGFPNLKWKCKPMKEFIDLNEWVSQVVDSEKEDEEFKLVCDKLERIVSRQDAGIVEFVNEIYPNHFIYSLEKGDKSNQGAWFCWDGQRWRSNDLPLKNVITYEVEKAVEKLLLPYSHYKFEPIDKDDEPNANQKIHNKATLAFNSIVSKITKANEVGNIVLQAKQSFANYTLEFDNKPYLFGFENGVLSLDELIFRPYHFEDKVSFSCGYNFIPFNPKIKVFEIDEKPFIRKTMLEQDIIATERILSFFKEIQPDPAIRKLVLILVASGLIGIAIELFTIFNGGGRNGKGVLNTLVCNSLGDYAVKMSASVLTELKKNSGASNPEVAKINKKRYVYWNEPPKGVPLQNSICKELTGGGTIQARENYSNKTCVKLDLTLIGECNSKPPMAEKPEDADVERVVDILFGSRFTDDDEEVDDIKVFKKDNTLKDTFENEEYKVALINILIDYLIELKEQKLNVKCFIPESVKIRSLEYLNKSNDVNNLFLEVFELKQDGVEYIDKDGNNFDEDWTLPSIASILRSSRTSFHSLPKKVQQELTKDTIKQFFITNKIYKKMIKNDTVRHAFILQNYRLKKPDIDDE